MQRVMTTIIAAGVIIILVKRSLSPRQPGITVYRSVSSVVGMQRPMSNDYGMRDHEPPPPSPPFLGFPNEQAKARRRAGGGISFSGGSSWRRKNGASEGCLNLSLDSTEGDDEILMSSCGSSVGSSSSATYASFIGDAMASSSLDSSWSMASVDANDREVRFSNEISLQKGA